MSDIDIELYGYLIDHLDAISDQWLALRKKEKGSIYSVDAGEEVEHTLREQNRLTNVTIASSLLADEKQFQESKEKWAQIVAKSRIQSNTPIYEVLGALSKVRKIYWSFVKQFSSLKGEVVTKEDLQRWGGVIHLAFDELYVEFSEMYFKLMTNRLTAQLNLIDELSTPVIKITSESGVLPLIGDIDTYRAKKILEYVPKKSVDIGITRLYIDLSGVSIIDTMVAHQLYDMAQILDLLGIQARITGIRPEIAQTAIQLGLDFSSIDTYGSLQQVLAEEFLIVAE
ncbi:STAS domain-containing protein [Siminovitchia sp. FSL W7-1587]|uniref:STAS domain-containing protein n=1 Tax=Siminovitchia sp. FSL W7-1587 TaxID=2954699 RepID=UPI0030D53413